MRNIAKRTVAMLLLVVMVLSCFSSALVVTFASETTNDTGSSETTLIDPLVVEDDSGNSSGDVESDSEGTDNTKDLVPNGQSNVLPNSEEQDNTTESEEPEDNSVDVSQPSETVTSPADEPAGLKDIPTTLPEEDNEVDLPEEGKANQPTEDVEADLPEENETQPTNEVDEAKEPTVHYTKIEAETHSNSHLYDKDPIANDKASNGYVVGGHEIESVFDLEMYDDLATSDLEYTPYVKYNVSAAIAGTYELHIGVALENLKDVEDFYIPVVVNEKVYKAVCEEFEGEDGIYEFSVEVELKEGKNEVYCITYDAETYLCLIANDVSALSDAVVNFDYLGIPEGIEALEKDKESEELTEPSEPEEPTEPTDPEEGEGSEEEIIIPPEVINPGNEGELVPLGSGSSGSGTGSGAGGGTSNPSSGNLEFYAHGVTMQVVTFPYGSSFNRENSYTNVTNAIQNYTVGSTNTIYDGTSVAAIFIGDPRTGRIYKMASSSKTGKLQTLGRTALNGWGNAYSIDPRGDSVSSVSGMASYSTSQITMNAPNDIEKFLQRIIFGNSFGAWDKSNVAKDSSGNTLEGNMSATSAMDVSLFARTLRYLGVGEDLINNYVKGYSGQLDPVADANVQIPTIIWSYAVLECNNWVGGSTGTDKSVVYNDSSAVGSNNGTTWISRESWGSYRWEYNIYTIGDLLRRKHTEDQFGAWWKNTGYASIDANKAAISSMRCYWPTSGSYACKMAFGIKHDPSEGTGFGTANEMASYMVGSGYINYINANGVDNNSGAKYYFRGYWTPYGERDPEGNLSVQKAIFPSSFANDANRAGWVMELYTTQAAANNATGAVASATTNAAGVATFTGLKPGTTYYIREAPASRQSGRSGWTLSSTVLAGTVVSGKTTSVGAITNGVPGQITVRKGLTSSSTTNKLNGWVYWVSTNNTFTNVVATLTTDANGNASTGYVLAPGTYYVKEAPMAYQTRSDKSNYILDETVTSVSATSGASRTVFKSGSTYTSVNTEKGWINVKKGTVGASSLTNPASGWVFYVYSDANCATYVTSITTGADGTGSSARLTAGNYWVKEAPVSGQTRSDKNLWVLGTNVYPVTVTAGSGVNAYSGSGSTTVNYYGKYLQVTKAPTSATCWEQIKNNGMYSFAGAQFKLSAPGYTDETVTTGADGKVVSKTLYTSGTVVTVTEIVAPKGFMLDSNPQTVTIPATADEYAYITMTDKPSFDPVGLNFSKEDPITGNPQGSSSFAGAIFKMEYYDNASWSGNPVRTWYLKTNSSGLFTYHSNYLAEGYTSSALYTDASGRYSLPIGSVKLTEVSAPYGYSVMPALYASITQPANGSEAAFHWTTDSLSVVEGGNGSYSGKEPVDSTTFGGFTLRKNDANGITNVQGDVPNLIATFQVINRSANSVKIGAFAEADPGAVCYQFSTNASGYFSSGTIFPVGTYEIKEITPPTGMNINSSWSQTFEISQTTKSHDFTTNDKACANEPMRGGLTVQKFDNDDNTAIYQGESSLAGAVLKVVNNSAKSVYTDRDGNGTYAWYAPGETCLYITTNANGVATSAANALPYGTYTVSEHAPSTGYRLNSSWSKQFTIRSEGEIFQAINLTDDSTDPLGSLPEDVIRGGVKIVKYDALLGTNTGSNAHLDGITYSVYSDNDNYVYVNGVKYNRGDLVATMTLSWNASEGKWIAQLSNTTLPYGTYTVRENPKSAGSDYANDYYFLANENDVVEEYTFSIRTNGQVVTTSVDNKAMEFHNMPIGRIELLKVNTRGETLAGVKFSLEWSDDGVTWTPVQSIAGGTLVKGGSTTVGIDNGCLYTGSTGSLSYEGLDPRLQYRLVEVETLNGYQMLSEAVHIGRLIRTDDATMEVNCKVVNSEVFTLPKSGSHDMFALSICLAICATISFVALAYYRKKEEV